LASVQANYGLIPKQAALEIERFYNIFSVDEEFLKETGANFVKTNHSLLGLINAVKKRCGSQGGEWLCYGATVQDITDTHLVSVLMQVRQLFADQIKELEKILIPLALEHRLTPMCGRTHGQPGLPITFGFKVAGWLDEFKRHRLRLNELKSRLGVGQLCGGVGSLSSFGPDALQLQAEFMQRMELEPPVISWTSSRDRLSEWLNTLAMITSTGDRIGQEVFNLQRPEIAELSEAFIPGAVGSITMPHKRNPEISEHLGTLSRVVRHHAAHMTENLVHSHERDGRSWKSEWAIIPDATLAAGKSLMLLKSLIQGLQINTERMRQNIDATKGFVNAENVMLTVASKIGKQSAHELIYTIAMRAHEHNKPLKQALLDNNQVCELLTQDEINSLFDLEKSVGYCAEMVDQVIEGINLP
nr:adenylosuccinate lyase family protein [Rhodospirillales bacterium]